MTSMSRRRSVYFFQMRLFHYRVSLFEQMRILADKKGIDLHLICGQASKNAASRNDEGQLNWAWKVQNKYLSLEERTDLCWQPTPVGLPKPDLVVLMQENRILSNYPWLLKRWLGGPKVAYWGHGRDLQAANSDSLRNRFKRRLAFYVDWYFGYTELTRSLLLADGFPDSRITVVNNSIDTERFKSDLASISNDVKKELRKELSLPPNGMVALYCGSLYPDKKLSFLLEASKLVHEKHPGFRLVIVGDGPSSKELKNLISGIDWVKWVGQKRGVEKAAYFSVASVLVNPGGVGLHVLDAFVSGLPLITTRGALHGPEIAYLVNERNGIITDDSVMEFANAMISTIENPERYKRLSDAARIDSEYYSVENMAAHFVEGMAACLAAPAFR